MSYTDYLTKRLLRQSEYLEERYGAVHNAPPEERERLADYAIDLARDSTHRTVNVTYYPPGVEAQGPFNPGNFMLTRREDSLTGPPTSFGQWVRYWRLRKYRYHFWTHATMLYREDGSIVESKEWGVEENHISAYRDHHYALVEIDASEEQRALMVGFFDDVMSERHGRNRYDYLSVCVLIPLQIVTGGLWAFARSNTYFCSGALAEALAKTVTSFFRTPVGMTPVDLAFVYDVRGPDRKCKK